MSTKLSKVPKQDQSYRLPANQIAPTVMPSAAVAAQAASIGQRPLTPTSGGTFKQEHGQQQDNGVG